MNGGLCVFMSGPRRSEETLTLSWLCGCRQDHFTGGFGFKRRADALHDAFKVKIHSLLHVCLAAQLHQFYWLVADSEGSRVDVSSYLSFENINIFQLFLLLFSILYL